MVDGDLKRDQDFVDDLSIKVFPIVDKSMMR